MRAIRVLLRAAVVVTCSAAGALLAIANRWGARPSACRDMVDAASCVAAGAAPWAVALATLSGGLFAVALLQVFWTRKEPTAPEPAGGLRRRRRARSGR